MRLLQIWQPWYLDLGTLVAHSISWILIINQVKEMLKHFTQIARKKKTIVCYKLIVALYCVWEAKITIKNP